MTRSAGTLAPSDSSTSSPDDFRRYSGGPYLYAVFYKMLFQIDSHIRIQRRIDLRQLLDQGHSDPQSGPRFSHISSPMKPLPITTADFGFWTLMNVLIRFISPIV